MTIPEFFSFTPRERVILTRLGSELRPVADDVVRECNQWLQALDDGALAPLKQEDLARLSQLGILGFLQSLSDGTLEAFAGMLARELLELGPGIGTAYPQIVSSWPAAHHALLRQAAQIYAGRPELGPALQALAKAASYVQTLVVRTLIADRDQALAETQRSEQLLRSIIDATPDWIFIKDQNHRFRLVNRSYAQAFHAKPEEFVGKDNLEVGFPEELVKGSPEKGIRGLWTDDRQVMDSGEILTIPRDLVAVDGEMRVFDTVKVPLRNAEGQVWGLLGIARDMTELKQAEEELRNYRDRLAELVEKRTAELRLANERLRQEVVERRRAEEKVKENEQFLQAIFDGILDGISILDKDLTILRVNQPMEQWYAYMMPLVGKKCYYAYHRRQAPCEVCPTIRAIRTGTPQIDEIPRTGPSRVEGLLELYAFPRFDEEGRVVQVIEYIRDITERKRLEERALRTERLAAMGRLAAALAHEVNNPLQALSTSLELALDFPLEEEERQQHLHAVRREIDRLMEVTSRVLDFARPARVERRPTAIAGVVHHALALAAKQLQQRHIAVQVDLPEGLPLVLASGDHLAQVFLNLIINALDAMPNGGRLEVAARLAGSHVEITFADSGPGIDPEALPMIFEPFFTTKESGTGLGLSISHGIIQQHHGTITATNAPGGGAILTISLPALG